MLLSLTRKMVLTGVNGRASYATASYEDAVKALNGLQSNAAYLRNVKKHDASSNATLREMTKYLVRSGITSDDLDRLSVIHVAGTKGKGSVCAFVESTLRAHGVKTGLYTSPHLVSVRERMRIDGKPIDRETFARYFWRLYKRLEKGRDHETDMPPYFKFLTLLMFHVFLEATIDVAIIEVGIGGEYDCTNVVRNPICVGITSLGLEHTGLLGNTLESIAHQKSGIFKRATAAMSVPQSADAMRVLEKRSRERECTLEVVPAFENYPWSRIPVLGITGEFQRYNASLAVRLSSVWLSSNEDRAAFSLETAASALSRCKWPGRTQILRDDRIDFYLDGAHTLESIDYCVAWFRESTSNHRGKRVLVFNTTGNRDSAEFLSRLRTIDFHRVFFVPNVAGKLGTIDQLNYSIPGDEQIARCEMHRKIWGGDATCASNVSQAIDEINAVGDDEDCNERICMLVTGSLHLVGAVLAIVDPDLSRSTR